MGRVLIEMKEQGQRATRGKPKMSGSVTLKKPSLPDLGISRNLSSQAQKIATLEGVFRPQLRSI